MVTTDDAENGGERLARNYSGVADGYAECWSPLLRPVGRRLLEALPWDGARRVIDVGTGTGALIPDARQLAPSARTIGIDRSSGMLAVAARTGATVASMDAMRLGFRPGAFDVAIMAFVLFHVPQPIVALTEVHRVLRPRGALGLVTWADDPQPPATQVWEEELTTAGAWDPSPMPPPQHALMNTREKISDLLTSASFIPTRVWVERIEHQWDVPRFIALRTRFGETKRKLETLDAGRRREVLGRIAERMSRLGSGDFLYRGSAICAVAMR